ncbi:unnamed protein product [Pleuronectes platessa]|uniref:Uncharacterized protein n=1 Tax=Pleuronectes platessa TaxID=8262 RepID=A0A9N7YKX3_PLEPL|nr:unnamed protein product [Pleuronectes platessa]
MLLFSTGFLKNNMMVYIAEAVLVVLKALKPDLFSPGTCHEIRDVLRNRSVSMARADGPHQGSVSAWQERRQRPLSQPVPYALHYPMEGRRRQLSGQSLLSHIRIEDEEEEIEEEELVAVIHPYAFSRHRLGSDMEQDELEIQEATSTSKVSNPHCSPRPDPGCFTLDHQADSYYLEPLMPAISKPAKEKSISLNKQEESVRVAVEQRLQGKRPAIGESAKLKEDLKVSERDDKEGGSGRSSPCLSTASWASSCSASGSASVKMTSFAERKLLKLGLRDGFSSTSSSQKTTPDALRTTPALPGN